MDTPRKFWQSSLLHFVLIFGSLVFALPYFWLVGTSWKLDKEVQSEQITILPQKPEPRLVSPYIDERQFPDLEKPEDLGRHRWAEWMQEVLQRELGATVDAWIAQGDDRLAGLDHEKLRTELIQGAFQRLKNVLPYDAWSSLDEMSFAAAVHERLVPADITELFEQAYRYFAVGKVLLKDRNYRIHDLTGQTPVDELWHVDAGADVVRIEPRIEADRPVGVLHYDFSKGEAFDMAAMLDLPVSSDAWKRLSISFRRDQTWHEMRVFVELEGRLLRSVDPKYLGEDTWWEVNLQEPSSDDERMSARNYVLLREVDHGPQYDHGQGRMRLRLRLTRSSIPEAYWAKGTENYRKAFEQVPFWRYFKTSVFLVIANILGTALSCSLVAFAFARLQWPGRDLCFVLVLATMMIPPQVTMIPSFVIYKYLGWYNTLAPLWVPNLLAVNAFAIFLLRQAMKGIPKELEEAAQIDGCGWWRIYWTMALPLMRPTIAAISIFTFMFVWNDFMTPLIYVNDQRLYPLALGLFSFMAGRENQFTLIMAGSMIMTLPVILTFFFAQRHFIQGVTMTGMKN
ncbi:MAG TPA: carbohydrate ABC transporter permease [Phycisphaerae bacterium]|nr:carbohydrate ABC transporter permease [Phycisphaerae bacterium]